MPYTEAGVGYRNTDTSKDAAEKVMSHMRRAVLDRLLAIGPSTGDELAQSLGVPVTSVRPRITDLARLGYVEDSGERRQNAAGRSAIVWAVRQDDDEC